MPKVPSDPHRRRLLRLDEEFREWLRHQPSAFSGRFSEWHDGIGMSIPAHVRRAGEAGVAYKPLFRCIPLTDSEHKLTHQHGESALADPDWFETRAGEYLGRWLSNLNATDAEMVRAEFET